MRVRISNLAKYASGYQLGYEAVLASVERYPPEYAHQHATSDYVRPRRELSDSGVWVYAADAQSGFLAACDEWERIVKWYDISTAARDNLTEAFLEYRARSFQFIAGSDVEFSVPALNDEGDLLVRRSRPGDYRLCCGCVLVIDRDECIHCNRTPEQGSRARVR
jgi:hypothetical protein